MKILIIGATGMLGTDLVKTFKNHDVTAWGSKDIDITDFQEVDSKIKALKPEVVINAAAYTAVDDCEINRDLAMKVNGEGPGNLAKVCSAINAILVHYSTDYIFNGQKKDGYNEDYNEIAPLNVYGESKALGEKLIRENCKKYYILRIAWLYGKNGKNFVDTMLKLGKEKPQLKVVNDQHGSPTYTADVAQRTKKILEAIKPNFGIYHATNSGNCTWYEFTKEIFRIKNISVKVAPCSTEEFPRPAKRPAYSILLNTKLPPMRSWQEALGEYLNQVS
jgi:dTDP-4-dehydrorhamnose reductase